MILPRHAICGCLLLVGGASLLHAGPFSGALNDPLNPYDAPVPGFIGPDGLGKAALNDGMGGTINPRNRVNPLFFGWAFAVTNYQRSDNDGLYDDPYLALGPVTGDNFDVVSLGDLTGPEITAGNAPGSVTLQIATPEQPVKDMQGADFVVFENAIMSATGGIFADLGFVEVSSDGVTFARFPSTSLTAGNITSYGTINSTDVFNLAGKHANAYGDCWGTPFDLAQLANHPQVLNGTVNLSNIQYVRVVDIPGNGSFKDAASPFHYIFDPWLTAGSGGLDLEAVGAISVPMTFDQWQDWKLLSGGQRGASSDPDHDGATNLVEFALGMDPLLSDAERLPSCISDNGNICLQFDRDTRAQGVTVEVLGCTALQQPWQPYAKALPGGELLPVAAGSAEIMTQSASGIASVSVVKRHHVSCGSGVHFLRLRVTLTP